MKKAYWIIGIVIILAVGALIYFNLSKEPPKNLYEDDKGYPMVNSLNGSERLELLTDQSSTSYGNLNFKYDEINGPISPKEHDY